MQFKETMDLITLKVSNTHLIVQKNTNLRQSYSKTNRRSKSNQLFYAKESKEEPK